MGKQKSQVESYSTTTLYILRIYCLYNVLLEIEFDQMEIEELRETVSMFKNQLNDITFKRNFLQLEMVIYRPMRSLTDTHIIHLLNFI